jgi:hypothetical protein
MFTSYLKSTCALTVPLSMNVGDVPDLCVFASPRQDVDELCKVSIGRALRVAISIIARWEIRINGLRVSLK